MMPDLLRKSILFGLGAIHLTKEKVEEYVNTLVKENNINEEEGKKIVQEVLDKTNEYKNKQYDSIKKVVEDVLREMGVATKKDIDDLASKINKD
jgi:polyhydroxyalkanoate synthesis regulator phasin